MNRTFVSLTAGVYTSISATRFSRRVELQEDGSVASVGLSVKFPEDGYTQAYGYLQAEQPVVLGNKIAHGLGQGYILGWPTQTGLNARTADVYCKVSCLTGTTKLIVTEYD